MNSAISGESSEFRAIFLTKLLITLNWSFQRLLLFLWGKRASCWVMTSPSDPGSPPGKGVVTCQPGRQPLLLPLPSTWLPSFWVPHGPQYIGRLCCFHGYNQSPTATERQPVRCQGVIWQSWGDMNSPLYPVYGMSPNLLCSKSSKRVVNQLILVCRGAVAKLHWVQPKHQIFMILILEVASLKTRREQNSSFWDLWGRVCLVSCLGPCGFLAFVGL